MAPGVEKLVLMKFLFIFFTSTIFIQPSIFADNPQKTSLFCTSHSLKNSSSQNSVYSFHVDLQNQKMEKIIQKNGSSQIDSLLELLPGAYSDGSGFSLLTGFRRLQFFQYEIVILAAENGVIPGLNYVNKVSGDGYYTLARYSSSNGLPPPQGKNVRLLELSRKQRVFCTTQ